MTDPSTHLFWITSRAAGTTAMILASASVGYGLALSLRLGKRGRADRRNIHQTLALATLVAIAVHGLVLVGDRYLHPSLLDVTVPFALSYKEIPTAIGIISGWTLGLLALSYHARRLVGRQRWRTIHRFTLLAWLGALVHTLTEGTNAGQPWFLALLGVAVAPVLALLLARVGAGAARATLPGRAAALSGRGMAPRAYSSGLPGSGDGR